MCRKNIVVKPASLGFTFQGPRYKKFGPSSGEAFVDNHLVDIISRCTREEKRFRITIDFSGTRAYSPSFIDEIFSRLVYYGYRKLVKSMRATGINGRADIDWLDFFHERRRFNLK